MRIKIYTVLSTGIYGVCNASSTGLLLRQNEEYSCINELHFTVCVIVEKGSKLSVSLLTTTFISVSIKCNNCLHI